MTNKQKAQLQTADILAGVFNLAGLYRYPESRHSGIAPGAREILTQAIVTYRADLAPAAHTLVGPAREIWEKVEAGDVRPVAEALDLAAERAKRRRASA